MFHRFFKVFGLAAKSSLTSDFICLAAVFKASYPFFSGQLAFSFSDRMRLFRIRSYSSAASVSLSSHLRDVVPYAFSDLTAAVLSKRL